ncbi:hypothetical protein RJ640_002513, partial [Escallonia rubra]
MKEAQVEKKLLVTPGEELGDASEVKAGKGAYLAPHRNTVYASLNGLASFRRTVEVSGHKAYGAVPEPGSVVIARRAGIGVWSEARALVMKEGLASLQLSSNRAQVTKVMARTASADIMCVGPKSVREKFTGIIRQQDVRATEIDKVDMHSSFRPGDIVRALVLSLGDARAYYLSTAKNELGVVSAESTAGATMVPVSWTEMQCPLTGQTEQRKVAK